MRKLSFMLCIIATAFVSSCGGGYDDTERAEREADSLAREAIRQIEADFDHDVIIDTIPDTDTLIYQDTMIVR